MQKLSFILFLSLLVLAACESPKEKSLKAIKSLESNDSVFTNELMNSLKTQYVAFADQYPDDEHTPEYLFKAAQRSIAMDQTPEAITLLNRLIEKYPKSTQVPDAMFLLAYTYENNLNDLPKAKELYTNFIKLYPTHDLSEDAQFALDNLGKSPEELLKGADHMDE